jgi:dihydropteroate synthase
VPVIAAITPALPNVPISIDTSKPGVAAAAVDAGAALLNDVWGVGPTTRWPAWPPREAYLSS